jgi:hypothetical protein
LKDVNIEETIISILGNFAINRMREIRKVNRKAYVEDLGTTISVKVS